MSPQTMSIDGRFCGPPNSGHGGYVAGRLANLIGGDAEVTLRRPVPLDRPLGVRREGAAVSLCDGPVLIAEARPATPELTLPRPVAFGDAAHAVAANAYVNDTFSRCFACGPARAPGDGLRIVVGEAGDGLLAAPWMPGPDLVDERGMVDPVFVWAALDCPSGFAVSDKAGEPTLLGRMTGRVVASLKAGSRAVIMAWPLATEGRKRFAASALFDEDGRCLAQAHSIWFRSRAD